MYNQDRMNSAARDTITKPAKALWNGAMALGNNVYDRASSNLGNVRDAWYGGVNTVKSIPSALQNVDNSYGDNVRSDLADLGMKGGFSGGGGQDSTNSGGTGGANIASGSNSNSVNGGSPIVNPTINSNTNPNGASSGLGLQNTKTDPVQINSGPAPGPATAPALDFGAYNSSLRGLGTNQQSVIPEGVSPPYAGNSTVAPVAPVAPKVMGNDFSDANGAAQGYAPKVSDKLMAARKREADKVQEGRERYIKNSMAGMYKAADGPVIGGMGSRGGYKPITKSGGYRKPRYDNDRYTPGEISRKQSLDLLNEMSKAPIV